MARFVDDESKNKRGGRGMDVSSWPRFNYGNVPRQRNGHDCGEPALVLTHERHRRILREFRFLFVGFLAITD